MRCPVQPGRDTLRPGQEPSCSVRYSPVLTSGMRCDAGWRKQQHAPVVLPAGFLLLLSFTQLSALIEDQPLRARGSAGEGAGISPRSSGVRFLRGGGQGLILWVQGLTPGLVGAMRSLIVRMRRMRGA